MDTKEALKSFELDARLFYDAIAFSTDDYPYIIDMQRDIALVSDNMRDDFDLPDSLVPGLIPLWWSPVWSARVKSTRSPGCSRTTNA